MRTPVFINGNILSFLVAKITAADSEQYTHKQNGDKRSGKISHTMLACISGTKLMLMKNDFQHHVQCCQLEALS